MKYSIIYASNDFSDLSNDLGLFKEELCKEKNLDFKSQEDFRLLALDSIQQYLLSLTSYIRAFMRLQQLVSQPEFLKILNVGINTVKEFEESGIIYKFPIESLVTMIHFQIDSFLGEICSLKGSPQTGFYKRMKKVLDEIDIDDGIKEGHQNTLQCLAFFRNSFHNRGFHSIFRGNWKGGIEPQKGEIDREFATEESTIVFKHNETITYNWRSAFLLIKESVESLKFLTKALDIQ